LGPKKYFNHLFIINSQSSICLDNAGEFISHAFHECCISIGIFVEHLVAHVHTQNGLAKSFIKRLKLVTRSLLMKDNLPLATWLYEILYVAILIRIEPTSYQKYYVM